VIENNEFGRMLKKAVMAYFKVFFQHFFGETEKIHKGLSKDRREGSTTTTSFPPSVKHTSIAARILVSVTYLFPPAV
jgi:hypothetical protein